jgi:hypothetical protein
VRDGGKREDNVEYPWRTIRDGKPAVVAPADEHFRVEDRMKTPTAKLMMKAAIVLTRVPMIWSEDDVSGGTSPS